MARVLCVDDDPAGLALLETLVAAGGHEVVTARDGEIALARAREIGIDLVVTDILMPHMDGYRLAMEFLKEPSLASIPFIFYTASYTDPEDEELASRLGAARFVRKPLEPRALLAVIDEVLTSAGVRSSDADFGAESGASILEQYSDRLVLKLEQKVAELERTLDGVIRAMVRVVEIRDPYTAGHQEGVSRLAEAIAERMGLNGERLAAVHTSALLHDIGKLSIPAEILSKPGKLTEVEYQIIQSHPVISYEVVRSIDFPWALAEHVHQHHERLDGSGYPRGLSGDDITLEARIIAVADIVEAMASHRPYRPARGIDAALDEIRRLRGTGLDEGAVDACIAVFDDGTFVFEHSIDTPG